MWFGWPGIEQGQIFPLKATKCDEISFEMVSLQTSTEISTFQANAAGKSKNETQK